MHQRAARSMRAAVAVGCEIITTWEASISQVCAPARRAMNRWAAGGSTWSSRPTRYQDGMVFQAGGPDGSPRARVSAGRRPAHRIFVVLPSS